MDDLTNDTYQTLTLPGEGLFKDKGSKFIALAYPVADEDAVKLTLQQLKKDYYDARHHCYAYILGYRQEKYRANDDGEPSNSAGTPILGQIRSRELTNTLVVVVRYFGGTKLGVSGLINAYKTAAAEALDAAQIAKLHIQDRLRVRFAYPQMNAVMKIIKKYSLNISHQEMHLDCTYDLLVRQKLSLEVRQQLEEIEGLSLEIQGT